VIQSKILLLPGWADHQLEAANLDVRHLERNNGFLRLRVGDYRVIFERLGCDVVVHRVGRRAGVYEGLESLALVRSGDGLRVLQVGQAEAPDTPTPHRPTVGRAARFEDVQNPLTPFTNERLAEAGLAPTEIAAVRRVPAEAAPDEVLAQLGVRARVIRLVAELWERPGHYLELLDRGPALDDELVRLEEEEAAARIAADISRSSLLTVSDLAAFAALLDRPVEDWMVYLHPAQLRAVSLSAEGPVRVRGGAGTGKTVVALHRARRLADELGGPVLLTTFVKNLPIVWDGLFETFAPDVRGRIEMRTVDSVSYEIFREGGGSLVPADEHRCKAIARALHSGEASCLGGLTSTQLLDEFTTVIEGRGLAGLDAYLALPRTGRGSRLPASSRRRVWQLYERYRERLEGDGMIGWNRMRREAFAMLSSGGVERSYSAVVVDEGQDLSEASMQLLIELAGGLPRPRLTVVGDGQQSIYPGGFSLRSLGVDVRGRSSVLRTNWRNTYAIWLAAQAFIAGETFDDLEEEEALTRTPDATPYPVRFGKAARLHLVDGGEAGEAEAVALLIAEDVERGADPGDCAALHPINRGTAKIESALKKLGLRVGRLENYKGRHEDKVWVGTFHRAKGLEFKRVYVAGLADGRWPLLRNDLDPETRGEERSRQVRAAFVALTRARDRLDIVCGGRVPAELERARGVLDE
jgi:superfamily I DNA/RNA helicase